MTLDLATYLYIALIPNSLLAILYPLRYLNSNHKNTSKIWFQANVNQKYFFFIFSNNFIQQESYMTAEIFKYLAEIN